MISEFLQHLFEHGRVRVRPVEQLAHAQSTHPDEQFVAIEFNSKDEAQARTILDAAMESWAHHLPKGLPPFDEGIALRAAQLLYLASSLLVHRAQSSKEAQKHIEHCVSRFTPQKGEATASEHLSVDLCLRYLKDVLRMNKAASENDPLNDQLECVLHQWPLSASGDCDVVAAESSTVWKHPALRLIWLDRIIAGNNRTALNTKYVTEEIRQRLGAFPDLLSVD